MVLSLVPQHKLVTTCNNRLYALVLFFYKVKSIYTLVNAKSTTTLILKVLANTMCSAFVMKHSVFIVNFESEHDS